MRFGDELSALLFLEITEKNRPWIRIEILKLTGHVLVLDISDWNKNQKGHYLTKVSLTLACFEKYESCDVSPLIFPHVGSRLFARLLLQT